LNDCIFSRVFLEPIFPNKKVWILSDTAVIQKGGCGTYSKTKLSFRTSLKDSISASSFVCILYMCYHTRAVFIPFWNLIQVREVWFEVTDAVSKIYQPEMLIYAQHDLISSRPFNIRCSISFCSLRSAYFFRYRAPFFAR
jgi:hypothetical protein